MSRHIYLDYAATTPMLPEVVEAMRPYFAELSGNPSAAHSYGQQSKAPVGPAHKAAAALLNCEPVNVFFTGNGTEANNTVIKGVADALRDKGNHIITTSIEHSSVLEPCRFLARRGCRVTELPVDACGMVDPDHVRRAIDTETILISVMHANNEVGTLQPVEEIGRIAREHGILLHTDAVQSFGHTPYSVDAMQVDFLTASAHKLYGPKGIGFVYMRKGVSCTPLLHGGGQERGRRSGTHNIPGIAGFGKAMEIARGEQAFKSETLQSLRRYLIQGLAGNCNGLRINGEPQRTLPHIISLTVEGVNNSQLLHALDEEGIFISRGAACGAASHDPSHVLLAMGMSLEQAHQTVRLSLGKNTSMTQLDEVIAVFPVIVAKLRRDASG